MSPILNWAISCPRPPAETAQPPCCASSRNQTLPEPACCSMRERCGMCSSWPHRYELCSACSTADSRRPLPRMRGFEGCQSGFHLPESAQRGFFPRCAARPRIHAQGTHGAAVRLDRLGHAGKSGADPGAAARYRDAALFSGACESRRPIPARKRLIFSGVGEFNRSQCVEKTAAWIFVAVGHERRFRSSAGRSNQTGGCRIWRRRNQTTTS